MNLYEFEGRQLFSKHGIKVPNGVLVRRGDDPSAHSVRSGQVKEAYESLGVKEVVVKAQILSGKRGKNKGIYFCSSADEANSAVKELFNSNICNQYVTAVLIAEKIDIVEEHYLSITYDTNAKQPILIYSAEGGMEIEDVEEEKILKKYLNIKDINENIVIDDVNINEMAGKLYKCFLEEDCRLVEINPLVKIPNREWYAVDSKVAIDEDAVFRHEEWKGLEPRTMMGRLPTERELAVKKIDEGENYYRGTAGKYIEMAGDIAVLFSGGGASIANMDALLKAGLEPANYTEYSGNPSREKVYKLAKIVLSKPGLKGLWIVGGVANFTDIAETFGGIVDALDEVKPNYPIVVRRAGPNEDKGMELMRECAERNKLEMKLFGKEESMSETATVLASMVRGD